MKKKSYETFYKMFLSIPLHLGTNFNFKVELIAIPSGDNKSKVSAHIHCTYLNTFIPKFRMIQQSTTTCVTSA